MPTALILVLIAAIAAGAYYWLSRPDVVEPVAPRKISTGGYLAQQGSGSVTVSLGIRNVSTEPLTVLSARFVPPQGLTAVATTVVATDGEGGAAFDPSGDLPPSTPVELGPGGTSSATVAARFTVDCEKFGGSEYAEQIFVTLRQDGDEWEEQLAPPVLGAGDTPWLYASAQVMCSGPAATGTPEPQQPPLD